MKQSLHTFLTCLVKEKSESNQTPKFLTASEGISDSPNIFTGKNGFNFFLLRLAPHLLRQLQSVIQLYSHLAALSEFNGHLDQFMELLCSLLTSPFICVSTYLFKPSLP